MNRHCPVCIPFALFIGLGAATLCAQDSRGLAVVAKGIIGDATVGRQIAVFIAINKYDEWMPLQHPVTDARAIKEILAEKYYIDQFDELYDADATKAAIFRLLDHLASSTHPEDSVLIYYAGHGYFDENSSTSFWAPVDGGKDRFEQKNWIASAQLRGYISNMKARHVLLISDSCFAGDILDTSRGTEPVINAEYYRNAYARVSRQVLTSGASENVSDISSFSRQLELALEGNTQPCIDPLTLFSQIRLGVTGSNPLYGSLKDSGQQMGGAFLLFRKGLDTVSVAPSGEPPAPSPASLTMAKGLVKIVATPNQASQIIATIRPAGGNINQAQSISHEVSLDSGSWIVEARLQNDTEMTFSKTIDVLGGRIVQVDVPILTHSMTWQRRELNNQLSGLQSDLAESQAAARTRRAWGWIGFGTTAVVGTISGFDGFAAYSDYSSAVAVTAINTARSRLTLDSALCIGSAIMAGLDLLLFIPPSGTIQQRIDEVKMQIQLLGQ